MIMFLTFEQGINKMIMLYVYKKIITKYRLRDTDRSIEKNETTCVAKDK